MKKKSKVIKRTVQNAIQYDAMIKNGVCYLGDDLYSAAMKFTDVNYQTAREEDQMSIFDKYMSLLNSLGSESGIQLVVHNRLIDKEEFKDNIFMEHKHDQLDYLRDEFNQMMEQKTYEGNNEIVTEKMIVYTTKNDNYEDAIKEVRLQNDEFYEKFKDFGCECSFLDGQKRLEEIYSILNPSKKFFFDYSQINKAFNTKDAIAPEGFDFSPSDKFKIGNRHARVLCLKNYSTELNDKFIDDLTRINHNLVISFHMKAVPRGEDIAMIKNNIAQMELQKMDEQRKAMKQGYDPDMIPMELKYSLEEATKLRDDIQKRNQRLFVCQFFVMINAESERSLQDVTKRVMTIAKKHTCELVALEYQQEDCLNACLPLGRTKVLAGRAGDGRTLTTPACAIMIPFTSEEIMNTKNCYYYGLNQITDNMILANRRSLDSPAGWILATPGSGKSFALKRERYQTILRTDDHVIQIDPEREYGELCKALKGTVVKMDIENGVFINPLDVDMTEGNYLKQVCSFMQTFMSQIICGSNGNMNNIEKSIVDRCTRLIFENYNLKMADKESGIVPQKPTLDDFYDCLMEQKEPLAHDMAISLEMYVKDGSYNIFSKQTNVDMSNRYIVYDIHDLDDSLKPLAMLVILESMWKTIKRNFEHGIRTFVDIDEIYLMLDNEYCVDFLFRLFKRARKFFTIVTGITQNVEDLLQIEKIRTMLSNSQFIMMLNQSTSDRDELAGILGLSNQQTKFITNSPRGTGLLVFGKTIIPFKDKMPNDTKLYELLTTDPEDKKKYKMRDKQLTAEVL